MSNITKNNKIYFPGIFALLGMAMGFFIFKKLYSYEYIGLIGLICGFLVGFGVGKLFEHLSNQKKI
ncbi:MAG: hypothetical protein E6929_03515 [Clostridium sp.]|nr:hypothetical protein [Clostridium sp.]